MREYSRRERVGLSLLTAIFAAVGCVLGYLFVVDTEMRTASAVLGIFGLLGGVVVFGKIVITGTSWSFFELSATTAIGLDDVEKPDSEQEDVSSSPH